MKMKKIRSTVAAVTATLLFSMPLVPAAETVMAEERDIMVEWQEQIGLHHEQPAQVSKAEPFKVELQHTNGEEVTLLYRSTDFSQPIALQMEHDKSGLLNATIPQTALWSTQIEYWFEVNNEQGVVKSAPYKVDLVEEVNNDSQSNSKLFITEINADDKNSPFIELYNNTNQIIDLKDYTIKIGEEHITLPNTNETMVESQETKVLWFVSEEDQSLTYTDFNNQFASKLTEEQVLQVPNKTSLTGNSVITVVDKETEDTEVTASYQINEDNPGQLFYFPTEGNEMNDGGLSTQGNPGHLIAGQVPTDPFIIEESSNETVKDETERSEENKDNTEQPEETEKIEITHDPITTIDGQKDLSVKTTVLGANKVTLHVQTGDQMEVQVLDFVKRNESNDYTVEVSKDQLWSPNFNYKIVAEQEDGSHVTFPEEGFVEADVQLKEDVDLQQVPPLLITEITPDTVNVNKADAYEFIEIYNNTNQPINMKDYKIIYRYPESSSSPEQHWNLTEDKVIESQESFIVWIHNDGNKDLTISDFNEQYGLNVTQNNVTIIKNDGMANGSERSLVIADNFNNEIVQATYNDGQKDVKADQGIVYKYPTEGTKMVKVGVSETITPLKVIAGQVPDEPVQVEFGQDKPVIEHEQPTLSDDQQEITLEVKVTSKSQQDILGVNAYVRQSNSMAYETITMKATEDPAFYTLTIPYEMIWNDQISYYFEASNREQTVVTDTYELSIPQPNVDFQKVPELFITELVPDSTNVNSLDGYEFIEVYNNSDQAIDFSDYTIRYRYPMEGPTADFFWGPANDDELMIPSGEAIVFWIINSGNQEKTTQDFNKHYGTDLEDGTELIKIYNGGMANSSHRSLVIATKTGHELSTASYYDEVNVDDTIADKGIFYRFPTDGGKELTKISAGKLDATPGSVMPEQVPVEKVQVTVDQEDPIIKDLTDKQEISSTDPVQIRAEIFDNNQVKTATLHVKTSEQEEFTKVNLLIGDNNRYQHTIYEPELIGRDNLEYFFTATDGVNTVTSETKTISIHHPDAVEGLRLNLSDDEIIAGDKIIKATSEQEPKDLALFIDDKEITDTFTALETEAYFAFDVRKTNLYFKNGVTMGDEILHIFDDTINNYTTLTVPVPAEKLQAGDNTISIRAGTKVSPFDEDSPENRDDFNAKNVRLVLADGTTIYDPNYQSTTGELPLGDNGSSIPVIDFTFTIDEEKFTSLAHELDSTKIADGKHVVKTTLDEETIQTSIVVDNTAPIIESMIEKDKLYKGAFTIDAEVTDVTSGVEEVTLQLDGQPITRPYETSSALLEAGAHELIITAIDKAGNETTETVPFETVDEQPLSPEQLEGEAKDTSAALSVRVTDPTNDDLSVSFYESYQYTAADQENMKVSAHAVDTEPPQSFKPEGETGFTADQLDQITQLDGQEFGTESTTQFPYHRFDVTVDEQVKADDDIEVVWNGSSLPGRKVTMYAWNYETEEWIDLVSTIAGDDAFKLIGSVTGEAYIQDHKISVIVQDQIEASTSEDFTFVWMTDTQYYSESYPFIYQRQVDWIADKQEELNIQYVFHTGDLVDDANDFAQWDVADQSMKVLDDANIPYGVLAGNHDVDHKTNDYNNYYKYFSTDRFSDRSYYGGSYLNNRGHYDLISASGNDFIMIYMGWGVDEEGIDWMNEVLEKYPNRKAFINVHEYLLASGTRSPIGEEIFQKVVLPNENVHAVLAGHYHNSQKVIDEIDDNGDGITDRTVYQMLANYQGGPEGGQGFMRLLNFNTETNEIDVQTYSPYLDKYNYYEPSVEPGKDEFNIPWDTTPELKKVATDHIEVNVYTNHLIDKIDEVPSGEIASVIWDGLDPNDKYSWHVVAEDDYGAQKRSDIWSFYTKDGEIVEPDPKPEPEPNPDPNPEPGPHPNPDKPVDPEVPGYEDDDPVIDNPSVEKPDTSDKDPTTPAPIDQNSNTGDGQSLPNTATNYYNYLVIGFVLLVMSGNVLWYRKVIKRA